jgi:3-oxoacyl-[acyl-carrier protein] reductase
MNLGLANKVALVTAASRGIGRAVAYRLADEGVQVALSARASERLEAAAAEYKGNAEGSIRTFPLDLMDAEATSGLVESVIKAYGRIDILVMNTPGPPIVPMMETTLKHWAQAYEQLLRPALQLALSASRAMAAQKSGSIVFITSTWVKQPAPGGGLSSVMRSGIAAFAKQLALELAASGVRINQVMPGATITERTTRIIEAKAKAQGTSVDEQRRRSIEQIPLGRMAEPAEIANAVVFLVSSASAFTTGATLQVDGGAVRSVT